MDFTKLYINGEWVEPNSKDFIEVENPATKKIFERVPRSNEEDVNRAIESATIAFETWQFSKLDDRINMMNKVVKELEKNIDIMAEVVVKELGCGFKFARDTHITPYIEDIKNFIEVSKTFEFEEKFDGYVVRKEPVGVVGTLTPWNYPFGQITKKIAPAMLTGNTVVLKPSQNTPLVAYYLTQAIHDAGFPKGVFNLVPGKGSEVGDVIAKHKDIRMISFTGSTKAGIEVSKIALDDVKRVALELGGKSPAVVLKGADLEVAVRATLDKVYSNTGQSCSAFTRLLVPREEKEAVEKIILEMSKDYKFGDPADPETLIGPLASKSQFDKVSYYIQKGIEEGAKLILGEVPKDDSKGYYVGPTIFTDVKNSMEIARNEIFGPVISIISYEDQEEAIKIANDTEYGLAGAVFGPDKEAREVANRIKAGSIVVNEGLRTHAAPFGGYKHSGIGREGGKYGLEECLEIKAIF